MIKTELWRLTRGFFSKKFAHFAWMGAAKTVMSVGLITLTVDIIGMSGLASGIVVTGILMVTNWVGIQIFIIGEATPESS